MPVHHTQDPRTWPPAHRDARRRPKRSGVWATSKYLGMDEEHYRWLGRVRHVHLVHHPGGDVALLPLDSEIDGSLRLHGPGTSWIGHAYIQLPATLRNRLRLGEIPVACRVVGLTPYLLMPQALRDGSGISSEPLETWEQRHRALHLFQRDGLRPAICGHWSHINTERANPRNAKSGCAVNWHSIRLDQDAYDHLVGPTRVLLAIAGSSLLVQRAGWDGGYVLRRRGLAWSCRIPDRLRPRLRRGRKLPLWNVERTFVGTEPTVILKDSAEPVTMGTKASTDGQNASHMSVEAV